MIIVISAKSLLVIAIRGGGHTLCCRPIVLGNSVGPNGIADPTKDEKGLVKVESSSSDYTPASVASIQATVHGTVAQPFCFGGTALDIVLYSTFT
jgi:hypothetical protein